MDQQPRNPRRLLRALPVLFIILSLACSLPGLPRPTPTGQAEVAPREAGPLATATAARPTPTEAPRPTPTPLPPALVETDPPPGSEIPLSKPITLVFNQPMDHASVEGALRGQPSLSGRFHWVDDTTVAFVPDAPLLPETNVTITVSATAQSIKGLALINPLAISYRTVGFLRLSQALPGPDSQDVDPASAVMASFNRPVVALGADQAELPAGFTIVDASGAAPAGRGEWINTSTYIFYPEPALYGGATYTVAINPNLTGADGSPLEPADKTGDAGDLLGVFPYQWSFTTALPRLSSVEPGFDAALVRLDRKIVLTFNQAMDAENVQANFNLLDPDGLPVQGAFTWSDDLKVMTFQPDGLLRRNAQYSIHLNGEARALGGAPLGSPLRSTFTTAQNLAVLSTQPGEGQVKYVYDSLTLHFSSFLPNQDPLAHMTIEPRVPNLGAYLDDGDGADGAGRAVVLNGFFSANTAYTLTVSAGLTDLWGDTLGEPFTLHFLTSPLDPGLVVAQGYDLLYLTPDRPVLPAQATNVSQATLTLGSVSFADFTAMLGPNGYEFRQSYRPPDARTWTQPLEVAADRSQTVELDLTAQGGPDTLAPGIYHLRLNVPGMPYQPFPYLLVVSRRNLTFKLSASDALVWALDLEAGGAAPVPNAPVGIYEDNGSPLALGTTDSQGVFHTEIPVLQDPYRTRIAMIGQPGQPDFALALSTWSMGAEPWEFGLPVDYTPPGLKVYLYSDRPIYRPGQTVYFRLVARQAVNGRYSLPDVSSLPVKVFDEMGLEIASIDLALSGLGTAHGEYTLPAEADPGYYRLGVVFANEATPGGVSAPPQYLDFQVADYRKPEINLSVALEPAAGPGEGLAGQPIVGRVSARYFFDAPAGDVPVHWALYARTASFALPGYQVGPEDTGWLVDFRFPSFSTFGRLVQEGDARTGPDGALELPFDAAALAGGEGDDLPEGARRQYTLEVTLQDESGLPVSGRADLLVNPAPFFIGVRPDSWTGQAGASLGYEVLVVDWEQAPAGSRPLHADFRKVEWVRQDPANEIFTGPQFIPRYTPVGEVDFTTGADGLARLAFTPPEPGTYQLAVIGEEGRTRTELTVWVGGAGQVAWPNLPNSRLRLTPEREEYAPGDTARVFIPNPFGEAAQALATIERGIVMRYQLLTLEGAGTTLELPLSADDAPNVYVSVTIVGRSSQAGRPERPNEIRRYEFRQGFVNLVVKPDEQILNVELTRQPERAGPGDELALSLRVTDADGQPVQGEFSLAVVDLAALALANPNSKEIVPAFYGQQPISVRTALALAVDPYRFSGANGRGGGGGEGMLPVVRETFPDTAYWNAEVVTDQNGLAQVTLRLPDTLTTWQIDARGVTADTRVGQAQAQVVTSRELLVRPVTPRFLVVGDRALLAAIVQNNTDHPLQGEATLQASGFALDEETSPASQPVSLPAGGRARVQWWGVAQDVENVDLVFTVSAGGLQDAARPAQGALPVYRYLSPQTYATAGLLEGDESQRLELVSLPRAAARAGPRPGQSSLRGELRVELSSSLAAGIIDALDTLGASRYGSTEEILSSFLPTLAVYKTLQASGIQSPRVDERLDRTLTEGLQRLKARQNQDGGWTWWPASAAESITSDYYLTAYVLFGLSYAGQAGVQVDGDASGSPGMIQRAVDFLVAGLWTPEMTSEPWRLDRLAMVHFALATAGRGDAAGAMALYAARDRLSPWARALLALTLEQVAPSGNQGQTLLSDLQATAVRSATGAHWEDPNHGWQNMSSPVFTTGVVLYALAQREPASGLLPEATRYLMASGPQAGGRQARGGWASSYETAWALLGLTEVVKGTGELAASFPYDAEVNGVVVARGQAGSPEEIQPATASVPVEDLHPNDPNALVIRRDPGAGRLYYSAYLTVSSPVESAAPLNRGVTLSRSYYASTQDRTPLQAARAGDRLTVRLTVTLPNDAYYLMVEDFIPAGAEILDTSLKTSLQGVEAEPPPLYDPARPFESGWGWWFFHPAQIHDNRIAWAADYLPAGTYELTYTLVPVQPGQYGVLPAHAWQFYFPEVQGSSAGEIFEITQQND